MRWDAEGNAHLCRSEADVQPGWTDQHPSNIPAEAAPAPPPDHPPPSNETPPAPEAPEVQEMTREEIVTALNEGGVQFSNNAPTKALYKKLRVALIEALSAVENIAFDPEADARTLLNLLPKPE